MAASRIEDPAHPSSAKSVVGSPMTRIDTDQPRNNEEGPPLTISIVIPVYNAEKTIGPLVCQLVDVLAEHALEVVLVNDGSRDASDAECRALFARFPETIVYLRLARNFGEHKAVMAGLNHARGDYVVIMDDDFQNPPEEVPRIVEHARNHGLDVVYTAYPSKRHHWFRNLGSRLNDLTAWLLLEKPRDLYLSSFKCLSKFVVAEVTRYKGPFPYIDGLILRCTREIGTVTVRHDARREGRSNYTLGKLLSLWLDMAASSAKPLRISLLAGVLMGTVGLLACVLIVAAGLLDADLRIGWPFAIATTVFLSGIQLTMLGLVGEYLGRLSLTSNQVPQFVIRERLGSDDRRGRGDPPQGSNP